MRIPEGVRHACLIAVMPTMLAGMGTLVMAFSPPKYPSPFDQYGIQKTDHQDAYVLSKTYSDILAAQEYSVLPGEEQSKNDLEAARGATDLASSRVINASYKSRRLEELASDISTMASQIHASSITQKSMYERVKNHIFSEYMTLPRPAVVWAESKISAEGDRMERQANAGCGLIIAGGLLTVIATGGNTRRCGTMLTDSSTGIAGSM